MSPLLPQHLSSIMTSLLSWHLCHDISPVIPLLLWHLPAVTASLSCHDISLLIPLSSHDTSPVSWHLSYDTSLLLWHLPAAMASLSCHDISSDTSLLSWHHFPVMKSLLWYLSPLMTYLLWYFSTSLLPQHFSPPVTPLSFDNISVQTGEKTVFSCCWKLHSVNITAWMASHREMIWKICRTVTLICFDFCTGNTFSRSNSSSSAPHVRGASENNAEPVMPTDVNSKRITAHSGSVILDKFSRKPTVEDNSPTGVCSFCFQHLLFLGRGYCRPVYWYDLGLFCTLKFSADEK